MKVAVNLHAGLGNKLFQIAFLIGLREKFKNHNSGFFKFEDFVCEILNYRREPHETVNWSYFIRGLNLLEIEDTKKKIISYSEPTLAPCKFIDYENLLLSAYNTGVEVQHFRGYFQTDKFFAHAKDIIQEQFKCPENVKNDIIKKYPELASRGVFLHIRRGDLVGKQLHDFKLLENGYYTRALRHFDGKDKKIFVCSDDIEWCRNNLTELLKEYKVEYIEDNEINTLWIMSLSRYGGVMSNSSFSWWGSYLNENIDKIIVTPDKFLTDERYDTSDLNHESFTVEPIYTLQNECTRLSESKLAVAVPCYHGHINSLEKLLVSISKQTSLPELVVVSCSGVNKEEQLQKLNSYIQQFKSFALKIIAHSDKKNASQNRNIAADHIITEFKFQNSDLISFFDADDEMHPQRLEIIRKVFETPETKLALHSYKFGDNPYDDYSLFISTPSSILSVNLAQYDCVKVDGSGYNTCHVIPPRLPIHNGQPVVRKEVFDKIRYNESVECYGREDSVFNCDVIRNFTEHKNIAFVPLSLSNYFQSHTNSFAN
jgi:hypothetical protein